MRAFPAPPPHSSTPASAARGGTTLRLAALERTPLAGAGNFLYRIPFEDGTAVLKVYFGSRHPLLHLRKTLSGRLFSGRTSHMPRARRRLELDCIRLWERHGLRCFGVRPEVVFEDLPAGGYLLFEDTPGRHLRDVFRDPALGEPQRLAIWRRFLAEWHRRHALALRHREPRLLHANFDVKHVMLWQDELLTFDFEIGYRSQDIRDLVGRELLAFLRSVGRFLGRATYDTFLDEVVRHYPDRALLRAAWEHAFRNRSPLLRAARRLDRRLRARHRKPFSKYAVARDLRRRLEATSAS